MATVIASFSTSLDGFTADPSGGVGPLFDWYGNGDVRIDWPGNEMVSDVTEPSARHLRHLIDSTGSLVVGRRIFDLTNGWDGRHPLGVPVWVVSHSVPEGWPRDDAPFTFVTSGVGTAVTAAREAAGDGLVGVAGPNVVQQCLNEGLLDEVHVDLVPVLLGEGIRLFDHLQGDPVMLEDPEASEGKRVTHLRYRLR